jgi:hypothetical protein
MHTSSPTPFSRSHPLKRGRRTSRATSPCAARVRVGSRSGGGFGREQAASFEEVGTGEGIEVARVCGGAARSGRTRPSRAAFSLSGEDRIVGRRSLSSSPRPRKLARSSSPSATVSRAASLAGTDSATAVVADEPVSASLARRPRASRARPRRASPWTYRLEWSSPAPRGRLRMRGPSRRPHRSTGRR